MKLPSLLIGLCGAVIWEISPTAALATSRGLPIDPGRESARQNAARIFNAVHSAGRQWGTAINHNGFSLIPAVMPKGTVAYHGSRQPDPPASLEWLAFEVEHAESFAMSGRFKKPPPQPPTSDLAGTQKPLHKPKTHSIVSGGDDDDGIISRGYLHTYQASRDLQLLLIDGSSAGKTSMGTLDSQDLLLRGKKTIGSGVWEEGERAQEICEILAEWGYDGFIRNEIGFEFVQCNFADGLDLVSSTRTFMIEDKLGGWDMSLWQWARAAAERYDGISGNRVRIDFSSMVSGFFFPINVSSLVPERPDLVRLGAASMEELFDIKQYLGRVAKEPRRFTVDWQAVIDLIVSRYADRLAYMDADDVRSDYFIQELERATLLYVDAPPLPESAPDPKKISIDNSTAIAINLCTQHYVLTALATKPLWSDSDTYIYTAVQNVTGRICQDLFEMRHLLLQASNPTGADDAYRINRHASNNDEIDRAIETSRAILHNLTETLAWTEWKKKRPCPADQILFVAMWPFGSSKDHWEPGCRTIQDMDDFHRGYWFEFDDVPSPPQDHV